MSLPNQIALGEFAKRREIGDLFRDALKVEKLVKLARRRGGEALKRKGVFFWDVPLYRLYSFYNIVQNAFNPPLGFLPIVGVHVLTLKSIFVSLGPMPPSGRRT